MDFFVLSEISNNNAYSGFTSGWKILQIKRDDLDHEWEMWKSFVFEHVYWFTGHVVVSEIVRIISPNVS